MNERSFSIRGEKMEFQTIQLEISDRLATLTLNRPNAMNAMDLNMLKELAHCFESLQDNEEVQVLIVKGAGKAFSAGGDIKMMLQTENAISFEDIMDYITRISQAYYQLPMITISQIHGAAAGLGFSLAIASDIVVAEESSKLAMNFIGIGLIPDGGGHFFMKERVGVPKAKQIIWEGKMMNGKEALAVGLIDQLAPEGSSQQVVSQLTDKLLASPISSMLETKSILHSQKLDELKVTLEKEAVSQLKMRNTNDHLEGIQAFVEKRPPKFIGK